MSNHITIELCAEDRARLDGISARLDALATQTQFLIEQLFDKPKKAEPEDDIRKALEAAINNSKPTFEEVAEATKNPTEQAEETTPPITPIKEENPTVKETADPTPTKAVTRAELGTKVRELMTKGFKEETKAIVREYAATVPAVPEDKVAECYNRLVALEG